MIPCFSFRVRQQHGYKNWRDTQRHGQCWTMTNRLHYYTWTAFLYFNTSSPTTLKSKFHYYIVPSLNEIYSIVLHPSSVKGKMLESMSTIRFLHFKMTQLVDLSYSRQHIAPADNITYLASIIKYCTSFQCAPHQCNWMITSVFIDLLTDMAYIAKELHFLQIQICFAWEP